MCGLLGFRGYGGLAVFTAKKLGSQWFMMESFVRVFLGIFKCTEVEKEGREGTNENASNASTHPAIIYSFQIMSVSLLIGNGCATALGEDTWETIEPVCGCCTFHYVDLVEDVRMRAWK
jgi:hypothetical protein